MTRSLTLLFFLAIQLRADINVIYLSWYSDPSTSMTIQWHTPEEMPQDTLYLQNDKEKWEPIQASHNLFNSLAIHAVNLENLHPDTEYLFQIGDDSNVYKFRTAPDSLEKPLRFIIGGDAFQTTKLFRKMNETIAKLDPLFCVIGGDIAYAINANPFRLKSAAFKRWISFLTEWKETMITSDGRMIPFLLAAGNHDLSSDNYETFFALFAFPKRQLYRAIDFGRYLSLILLDTDHFQPIKGAQTRWLDQALSEREDIPFRFPVYHEAAYPSFYPYDGRIPKQIRTHWCPLFDKYKISFSFENHNHTFKRTYPIQGGAIASEGVVYLGDGCWGASPRIPKNKWYLIKKARKNNVYQVDLTSSGAHIQAIDLLGEPFDSVTLSK